MTIKVANLLGALSLALADRFEDEMADEAGIGGAAVAALVLIDAEPGLTIEALAGITGVAQSSMTRAIAQLHASGFVTKTPGTDRRTLVLALTEAGRGRLSRMLDRRAAVLESALSAVAPEDRAAVERGLSAMLQALPRAPGDRFRICRLCDEGSCGPHAECPVERGATKLIKGRA